MVYYHASLSNSTFSKIMLAGSLKLAMVEVFIPQKSVNAITAGFPHYPESQLLTIFQNTTIWGNPTRLTMEIDAFGEWRSVLQHG